MDMIYMEPHWQMFEWAGKENHIHRIIADKSQFDSGRNGTRWHRELWIILISVLAFVF
jgi:hypothetical protein